MPLSPGSDESDHYSTDSDQQRYSDDEDFDSQPALHEKGRSGGRGLNDNEKGRAEAKGESDGEGGGGESKGGGISDGRSGAGVGDINLIPFDDLEVLDQIGGGGVGLVYEGRYRGRAVAVKTLFDPKVDEALKQEFMDELYVMARCNNPNVVGLEGACLKPPDLCFVMDLADSSLFDLLHNSRLDRFTLHQRLSMCHQVAKGLLYLHQMTPPVIHRDIKSHNVLVFNDNNSDDDIVLKLCDFGLVRTKTTAAGTPNYMAPELFRQASFSAAVDVYAFAVLACEIFTQQLPYRGYDPSDIARVVIAGERPEIPALDVPAPVADLIRRGWSGDAGERPGFEEIEETLARVIERTPRRTAMDDLDDDALFGM